MNAFFFVFCFFCGINTIGSSTKLMLYQASLSIMKSALEIVCIIIIYIITAASGPLMFRDSHDETQRRSLKIV